MAPDQFPASSIAAFRRARIFTAIVAAFLAVLTCAAIAGRLGFPPARALFNQMGWTIEGEDLIDLCLMAGGSVLLALVFAVVGPWIDPRD